MVVLQSKAPLHETSKAYTASRGRRAGEGLATFVLNPYPCLLFFCFALAVLIVVYLCQYLRRQEASTPGARAVVLYWLFPLHDISEIATRSDKKA